MTSQLAFHNTQFNVVRHNDQISLTSSDLAVALQYKNEKSITNLFNKNFDEFTPGMSEVIESVTSKNSETVNLTFSGNLKTRQRIFSLRGAHLIAMFARTPIAKEFRRWVLDILDREVVEAVIQPTISAEETYTLTLTRSELCSLCWVWNAAEYMREKIELLYPALKTLNSDYAPSFYSMAFEYQRTLEAGRKLLERETRLIETHPVAVVDESWRRVLPRLRNTRSY